MRFTAIKKAFLIAGIAAMAVSCGEKPVITVYPSSGGGSDIAVSPIEWDGNKRADITYQALVYSFADSDGDKVGDFNGIISKIDYLNALGVSAIWLSPVHPASSYHGYDILDYESTNPTFGNETEFKSMVDALHSAGIKVYLDYVLNHSSSSHPWFIDAKSSPDSKYRDYYIFSKSPAEDIAAGEIPTIASEGTTGYDAGQWFSTDTDAGEEGILRFDMDWTNASTPYVTVTRAEGTSPDGDTPAGKDDKFLYYGNNVCKRFINDGNGKYHLTADFSSDWGFLIRTSDSDSWPSGTKYGAASASSIIEFGKPFKLTNASDCSNIRFSLPVMYHSHFWTGAFADFNYGPAQQAEQSAAFKALTAAADKWIRMGVDGFRLDAVKHIYHNAYSNENPTFLKKFYDHCNAIYKAAGGSGDFYIVGEMLDSGENAAPYYAGIPALFEFSFWYKLSWALQNNTGCYFVKDILSLQQAYATYRSDYIEATKLSNHDENRTGSDLGNSTEKMKLAAAVLLTAQGSPYIYQGEELGYYGTKNNGDEYVRTPIMWDKNGSETAAAGVNNKIDKQMLKSSISVEAQQDDNNSVLNTYRTFCKLRNSVPALAKGKMIKHPDYNDSNTSDSAVAVWYMDCQDSRVLVVHNFSDKEQSLFLKDDLSHAIALQGTAKKSSSGSLAKLTLGSYSSIIFQL